LPLCCLEFACCAVLVCLPRRKLLFLLVQQGGQFLLIAVCLAEHFHAGFVGQRIAGLLGGRLGFVGVVTLLPAFGLELIGFGDSAG
jgi:hypothetical protein